MIQKTVKRNLKPQRWQKCPFCESKKEPDYKDLESLVIFISERGKIQNRGRTGACARHQRKVAAEIKRARFLSLVPYTSSR